MFLQSEFTGCTDGSLRLQRTLLSIHTNCAQGIQPWGTQPSPYLDELQVGKGPHSVVGTVRGQAGAVGGFRLQEGLQRGHGGLVN